MGTTQILGFQHKILIQNHVLLGETSVSFFKNGGNHISVYIQDKFIWVCNVPSAFKRDGNFPSQHESVRGL